MCKHIYLFFCIKKLVNINIYKKINLCYFIFAVDIPNFDRTICYREIKYYLISHFFRQNSTNIDKRK